MKIYRVLHKETQCLQPGGDTYWTTTVLYCGTDRDEARVAYYASEINDESFGPGNRCSRTSVTVLDDDADGFPEE